MDQVGVHAQALPHPGDILAERYVIESIIGCGAMSVVFGARHRVSGKRCAIKLLLPEQRASLPALESRGAAASVGGAGRLVGHFQHPHVLDVQDVGEVRGSYFAVMDWMDGESLEARLERVGSLSVVEVRNLLVPCIRGMQAAHGAGIVHRDLSPASIYICQGTARVPEIAKVLDFGVAEFSDGEAAARAALTRTTDLREAASDYLAPEQRCGLPADHRADVYAFGAIVYRALSGQLPTAASTHDRRLVFAEPPPLRSSAPGVSEAGDIARRAMSSELSERFQSLGELADALEFFRVAPRRLAAPQSVPPALPPRRSTPPDIPQWSMPRDIPRRSSPGEVPRRSSPSEVPRRSSPSEVPRRSSPSEVPRRSSPSEVPRRSSPSEVPRRSSPPGAAMDVPPSRGSDPRLSAPRVSFPPPAAVPRARRSNKWLYIAVAMAVLASAAALRLDDRSVDDTDVIASFEGVAGETPNPQPAPQETTPLPSEPLPSEPPPPSAASPIAAPTAPRAAVPPPPAAAIEPERPRALRLPLTPPPVRREREREPARPRAAGQPSGAAKPAQSPPPAPIAQPSANVDELPMSLF